MLCLAAGETLAALSRETGNRRKSLYELRNAYRKLGVAGLNRKLGHQPGWNLRQDEPPARPRQQLRPVLLVLRQNVHRGPDHDLHLRPKNHRRCQQAAVPGGYSQLRAARYRQDQVSYVLPRCPVGQRRRISHNGPGHRMRAACRHLQGKVTLAFPAAQKHDAAAANLAAFIDDGHGMRKRHKPERHGQQG